MNNFQKKIAGWLGLSQLVDAANPRERYRRPFEVITIGAVSDEIRTDDLQYLVSDSRKLYCNLGPAKGAIDDKATYAVGRAWDPKFTGQDKAWGKKAEAWLRTWYPVADARGGMFDFKTDLWLMSVCADRDGEVYVLLTQSASGMPQIQLIPTHMIGQRNKTDGRLEEGPYKGLTMKQGIVINDQGYAVAFQVLGTTAEEDKFYSARDLIQVFNPEWPDQLRGFPVFMHAILDLKDLRTVQGNEKMASAMCSAIGLIENNETGAPDPNDPMTLLRYGNTRSDGVTSQGPRSVIQDSQGVMVRFFRAATGSKLETLKNDRPGAAWDQFMNRLIRNACTGAGWPYELTWDASALGGANVRLLVARAMRTVEDRQDLLRPIARRVVGYAIAKAIKLGQLESNDEWYAWDFAMPARMSVDYGRDAAADREDYKLGLRNLTSLLAEQGQTLDQHIAERVDENDKLTEAGLPVYGPGGKEATDINASAPTQDPSANPAA